MLYRNLGNSGLKVSAISIGNNLSGDRSELEENFFQVVSKSIDSGINYFDTAETYQLGKAETVLGNILKRGDWDRDNLVISTKLYRFGKSVGLSRKRLLQSMRNSLSRLQLDYVDLLFLHRFDHETPLLETIQAVNHLIDKGRINYWGTSEFTPEQLMEVFKICEEKGLEPPIAEQCQYSMLFRERMEAALPYFFDNHGLGAATWSPLCGGFLSGKYNDGSAPEGSRFADPSSLPMFPKSRYLEVFSENLREKTLKMLREIGGIAGELGVTQAQLALAWCIQNKDVGTVITTASSAEQINSNLASIEISERLDAGMLIKIEEVMKNRPVTAMDWRKWVPRPPRR